MKIPQQLKIRPAISKKLPLRRLEMARWGGSLCVGMLISACTVGPDYKPLKPAVP